MDVKVEVLQHYRMSKRAEETAEIERDRKKRFETESRRRIPEALCLLEEFGEACFGRNPSGKANYRIQTGGHLIMLTGKLGGRNETHAVEMYLGAATDDFYAWYLTVREILDPREMLHFSTTDLSADGIRDGLGQAAEAIGASRIPNRESRT